MTAAARSTDPFLRLPDVIAETGLSKRTLYRKVGDGSFPEQHRISKRAVAWRLSDIEKWKAEQAPASTEN